MSAETTTKNQTVRLDGEHQKLAAQLQQTRAQSFQQLVEKLIEEEAQRQEQTWEAVAGRFIDDNQELFDKLADL